MYRIILLGGVIAGLAGCAASSSAGNVHREERREVATVVEAVPASLPAVQAACAAEGAVTVDSLVARPNRIELRVGETFSLADLTITPAGAHGTAPSPPYFVLRSPVAELDGAVIRAISAGQAEFRILPFCRYLREGKGATRATVIPVVVRP